MKKTIQVWILMSMILMNLCAAIEFIHMSDNSTMFSKETDKTVKGCAFMTGYKAFFVYYFAAKWTILSE